MRSPLLIVALATLALVGCAHKPPAAPKVAKAPVVLNADDQHAKVVFKMATTRAIASFKAGKSGSLAKVGNVYNDAVEQQMPGFGKGLMKGLTHAFGQARTFREILVPAGETTEIQGSSGWTTDDGLYRRTYSCGPLINELAAQGNKTYLVEFDLDGGVCIQNLFDITKEGQKDLIAKAQP